MSKAGESLRWEIEALFERPQPSELQPGVSYELLEVVGAGGFAVACLARRHSPAGDSLVVVKITRPRLVAESGELALRAIKKEAVALGRLNERTPPSPFVVRLVDTGSFTHVDGARTLALPWVAVEYVHGGAEGTTLRARVRYATERSGYGFHPARAARAILHLSTALSEIHSVGVVHRDTTPGNVLCCGFGDSELFKLSDFGIARPTGVASTFGDVTLGTPGYVAPEQVHLRSEIGPWTDVFGLAAVAYFMLTGRKCFPQASAMDAIMAAQANERRSLLDAPTLCPELAHTPARCAAVDRILARATAADPRDRYPTVQEFSAALLFALGEMGERAPASQRHVASVTARAAPDRRSWTWQKRCGSLCGPVITDVAWESDAHCLAITDAGLLYWDGTGWVEAMRLDGRIARIRSASAASWLAAEGSTIYELTREGMQALTTCPGGDVEIVDLEGPPRELSVVVGRTSAGALVAYPVSALRWFKPTLLGGFSALNSLCRVDDERWLLVGRSERGLATAACFRPLAHEVEPLGVAGTRALLCCAGQPTLGTAIAAGTDAQVIQWGRQSRGQVVSGAGDFSAAALDVSGQSWVAETGAIWMGAGEGYRRVFHDPDWRVPIVALFADVDAVVAIAADGSVVDGRAPDLEQTAVL